MLLRNALITDKTWQCLVDNLLYVFRIILFFQEKEDCFIWSHGHGLWCVYFVFGNVCPVLFCHPVVRSSKQFTIYFLTTYHRRSCYRCNGGKSPPDKGRNLSIRNQIVLKYWAQYKEISSWCFRRLSFSNKCMSLFIIYMKHSQQSAFVTLYWSQWLSVPNAVLISTRNEKTCPP